VDQDRLQQLIESLLFVSDEPMEIGKLALVIEAPAEDVDAAIEALAEATRDRGVRLQRQGRRVQLVTDPAAAPYVERLLGVQASNRLSTAALETLAIVAYRQPITRARIEAIRGVNCDRAVATLQSRGLIEEIGRLEAVGRPMLYATTFDFLQYFGLHSLAELPLLPDLPLPQESN
jgi:segregation and condensation protein B